MRTTPSRVRALRRTYETVKRSQVSEQAPLEEQHAWWRMHDRAKREYALADWQWESFVLRVCIGVAALLGIASVAYQPLTPAAVLATVLAVARCYVIFTRHAPE